MEDINILKRALEREKKARKAAEKNLEIKSQDLYLANCALQETNESLTTIVAHRTAQVQGINEFAKKLLDQKTVEEVCWSIAEHAISHFQLEDCIVYILDRSSMKLQQKAAFGNKNQDYRTIHQPIEIPVGQGVVGHVAATGKPLLVADTDKIEMYIQDDAKRYSELAVPLTIDGEVIGVLDSEHSQKNFFNNHHLSLFTTVASLAAIKIRNIFSHDAQRETESQLIQNQLKFKHIVESANEIIFESNSEGFFTYVNPISFERMKYSEDELTDLHFTDLVEESHRQKVMEFYLQQITDKNTDADIEFPAITKDGKTLWISQHTKFQYDDQGVFVSAMTVARDITEQKKYERTLQIQKEKYRGIINNMNLGLLEVDQDDRIMFANKSFLKMSGFEEREILNKRAGEVFALREHREVISNKNKLRNYGVSDIYTLPVKNKAGEDRWWLISGVPNYDDQGEIIGSIGIHLDLTEQKKLESQLAEAIVKAEDSAKAKELFLANMSHEIRTPLNAIIGILNEFPRTNLDLQQGELLHNVQQSAQHLLSILNNILDLTKIGSGEFLLDKHQFRPTEILRDIYSIFVLQARQKNLRLSFNSKIPKEYGYEGDSTRIRQVLVNLIGNSIKFTKEGTISLEASIVEKGDQSHMISFVVEDTGIGMNRDYLEKLFTKFTQEDGSITKNYGGTGLGMALTNEIIQLMGGSIEVDSEKNRGTRIEVRLPIAFIENYDESSNRPEQVSKNLVNAKILLVEDNEINRLVVRMTLKAYKCQITEAENGKVALDILANESFDLILMDLQMPVMDGFETTKAIRNKLKITTPIIALTANAMKNTIDKCLSIGMNSYVIKPFDKKTMLQELSRQILQKNLPTPGLTAPANPIEQEPNKLFDLEELQDLSNGNTAFIEKMILLFIDQIPAAVTEMEKHLENQNYREMSRVAHRIKPTLQKMRIHTVKDPIYQIEHLDPERASDSFLHELLNVIRSTINTVVKQLQTELEHSSS